MAYQTALFATTLSDFTVIYHAAAPPFTLYCFMHAAADCK